MFMGALLASIAECDIAIGIFAAVLLMCLLGTDTEHNLLVRDIQQDVHGSSQQARKR